MLIKFFFFFPFTIFNDTSTIVSSFYASFIKNYELENSFISYMVISFRQYEEFVDLNFYFVHKVSMVLFLI